MSRIKGGIRVVSYCLAALSVLPYTSCVKDDRSDCPDPDEFRLYVKVVDTETGRDITSNGDTDEVIVALFDRNGRFVATKIFDSEEISGRRPWTITDFDMDGIQVSAWGDLGNKVEQANPNGAIASAEFVKLPTDSEGYSPSPDEFFFGYDRITTPTRTSRSEEVVITQKNAKIHITVRGLPVNDEADYYFVIEAPQNGYDFLGDPNKTPCRVRRTGEFNDAKDYISPLPYLMIHSADPDNVGPLDGATVKLFSVLPGGDVQIASAERAANGKYIGLYPGKTTNVLIDLSSGDQMEVRIEMTGWREVYQWSEW